MNKAEEMEVETEDENVEEKGDILDSSVFSNAKMFSCTLCDQKFTNKVTLLSAFLKQPHSHNLLLVKNYNSLVSKS